jgi:cell division transport system permease protein
VPTVLSITIVLLMTGLLGLIYYNAHLLNNYFKENFEIRVYLNDIADENTGVKFSLDIKKLTEVSKAEFISKDEAAEAEIKEQGIDFIANLGYNPLPHSIRIFLHPDYTDEASVKRLIQNIEKNPTVESVNFPQSLLSSINQNIQTVEVILLLIIVVFLLTTLFVINSTIRLNIFARRFLIKSMQFVGATDWFILKPFIGLYLKQGVVAAFLAISLLGGLLYWIKVNYAGLVNLDDLTPYIFIGISLIILSIVIILPATYFACRKYLRTDINKLY